MNGRETSGFHRRSLGERIDLLRELGVIDAEIARRLRSEDGLLTAETADRMIENTIGVFGLPFAVAPNFLVNGRDRIAPMVVEEPSVVAGVSSAAKLMRAAGGIEVTATDPVLIGQIQVAGLSDPDRAIRVLEQRQDELLAVANGLQPRLRARGGGAKDIEYFKFRLGDGGWTVVLHLLVDTCDAMGANIVNTMCEGLQPAVEEATGGRVGLTILSNLADRSLVTARVTIPLRLLKTGRFLPEQVRDGIVDANDFANADPYRAATHNKGIMNGIDAVAIATGNDWRSIEAAAHAYAVRDGAYRALTEWTRTDGGELAGQLRLPLKAGIVGGSLGSNPAARAGLAIAAVESATDLTELMGAVGLAQNFAALRALVTDGIQKGHMRLHARSVAAAAGAPAEVYDAVVAGLLQSGEIKEWKARQLIAELGHGGRGRPSAGTVAAAERAGAATGSACGKIILLGEHAAVYDKHVLALPLDAAVTAGVAEVPSGLRLTIPDWELDLEFESADRATGAAEMLSLIVRRLGIETGGLHVDVRSRIPPAMGLGSSAALSVAVIRALDRAFDLGLDDTHVNELAFECEKLAHGSPSGIDNTLAVFGQPVLFRRGARPPARYIELSEPPPLVIACSGTRGVTRAQVAGVRARYERRPALYETLFNEIDELSVAGAVALQARDYEALGAMFNVCQGLLNALEVSTPELEHMIHMARSAGAVGAKLTGAGGGGSIVALCPDRAAEVSRALSDAGYRIVTMK